MSTRQAVAPAPGTAKQRMEWMDTLRGLSIILVILLHALIFTYDNVDEAPQWLWNLNLAVGPYRMPLMVFLSGMLVPQSLAKGTKRYITGKLKNVAHPYFVWSAIMLVILAGASLTIGRSFDTSLILRVFYWPIEHLWFLGYLLVFYTIALATKKLDPLIVAAPAAIVAFAPVGGEWSRLWTLLCFFMLGVGAVRHAGWWTRVLNSRVAPWTAVLAFAMLFAISLRVGDTRYDAAITPLVIAAIVGACIASRAIGTPKFLRPVRFVGRESLVYYNAHGPTILISLVILRRLVPDVSNLLAFCVALSAPLLIGTALAIAVLCVPGVSWLFRFGASRPQRMPLGA